MEGLWELVPGVADDRADGLRYAGSGAPLADGAGFGGTLTGSLTAGDSVTYTATARRPAWIAPRGPDRGTATVCLDGAAVAAVKLYARAPRHRAPWSGRRPGRPTADTRSGSRPSPVASTSTPSPACPDR